MTHEMATALRESLTRFQEADRRLSAPPLSEAEIVAAASEYMEARAAHQAMCEQAAFTVATHNPPPPSGT